MEEKTFYYPENLQEKTIWFLWNIKDYAVMAGILVASIFSVLLTHTFLMFSLLVLYAFFTAKIKNGYSITKLLVLYGRFLITDKLIFKWR